MARSATGDRATDERVTAPYEVDPRGKRSAPRAPSQAGRGLVVASVLADAVFGVSAWLGPGRDRVSERALPYVIVVALGWALLDLRAAAMRPFALRWRLAWGAVAAVAAAAWVGVLAARGEAGDLSLPGGWFVVSVLGAIACRRALRLAEREPRASAAPRPAALRNRAILVGASAVVWMVCGIVESWRSNWWFGMVLAAGGVLGLGLAPELARPSGDRLLRPADCRRPQGWIVWPLAVPLLLARAAWVLATLPAP